MTPSAATELARLQRRADEFSAALRRGGAPASYRDWQASQRALNCAIALLAASISPSTHTTGVLP